MFSQHRKNALVPLTLLVIAVTTGCGKASSSGNVAVVSNPLAGPHAAFLLPGRMGNLFALLTATPLAQAAVSAFTSFTACNDTLIIRDGSGNPISVNGSTNLQVGQGLLSFSPTSGAPMSIGSLNIPAGTQISEVDITFANVPSICGGANYAVQFDPGTGPIQITQNTAFKFTYASPKTIQSSDTINLMFGAIVNAMVAKGSALNNSTIQSIAVGQAQ